MKSLPLKGLIPNSSYSVSVRGKSVGGDYTPWSKFVTFTTKADTLAPSVPSAPTVSLSGPQNIIIEHTLDLEYGGKLESDVVYLEVQTSDSTDNYTAQTVIGNIPVGPLSYSGVSQRFMYPAPSYNNNVFVKARVRAVDRSGNISAWSAWSTPSSTIPYFDAAYIGSLTVDTLSAEKITSGTLGLVNTLEDTKLSIGDNSTYIMLRNNHLTGSTSPKGQMYIATTGTPANPTGATGSGYRDINTKFYVDSTGKFSLGTGLYWDGSGLTLTGAVTATSGSFSGTINASGGDFTSYVTAGGTSIGKNWTVSSGGGLQNITGTYSGIKINAFNFMGVDALNNAVFSVGSETNHVQWANNQLNVRGNIIVSGGSFENYLTAGTSIYIGKNIQIGSKIGDLNAGTYQGILLDASANGGYNFWAHDGSTVKFQVGAEEQYVKWTGASLDIKGNINASTITGGLFRTAKTGTRLEISGVNDLNMGGSAAAIAVINDSLLYQGAIQYVSDIEIGSSIEIFPPGNQVNRSKIVLGDQGMKIVQKSNTAVTITAQTPTGNGGSARSVRNIYITAVGATPMGADGGDVWLTFV